MSCSKGDPFRTKYIHCVSDNTQLLLLLPLSAFFELIRSQYSPSLALKWCSWHSPSSFVKYTLSFEAEDSHGGGCEWLFRSMSYLFRYPLRPSSHEAVRVTEELSMMHSLPMYSLSDGQPFVLVPSPLVLLHSNNNFTHSAWPHSNWRGALSKLHATDS
ncbi:hypothetical protein T440DRAFT_296886 [Plenodomus tracheiphilus IPT5]|uniref:Uncharacterized protein n=1 Tax=Plenodomus tracheiphilus IPT5 TaxID=1408161 RepID=A0A6A7BFH8_9PLEO|nr:hypothetical protein T440DRAFT_296886 [Plenodomus tracheiphilus IPT5]